ncbi:MAG: hypothetical protein FWC12_11655 [Treponema sp.]|nr:hypothetical protein [Treponema sp.]
MSLSPSMVSGKPKPPIRYRPTPQEGQYIRYRLNLTGNNLVDISRKLKLHGTNTRKVIIGLRRSARIESEIAKILGKASWNDVVLEARSEIQKKPVDVIVREMKQKHDAKTKAVKSDMAAHIAEGVKRMSGNKTRRGA